MFSMYYLSTFICSFISLNLTSLEKSGQLISYNKLSWECLNRFTQFSLHAQIEQILLSDILSNIIIPISPMLSGFVLKPGSYSYDHGGRGYSCQLNIGTIGV